MHSSGQGERAVRNVLAFVRASDRGRAAKPRAPPSHARLPRVVGITSLSIALLASARGCGRPSLSAQQPQEGYTGGGQPKAVRERAGRVGRGKVGCWQQGAGREGPWAAQGRARAARPPRRRLLGQLNRSMPRSVHNRVFRCRNWPGCCSARGRKLTVSLQNPTVAPKWSTKRPTGRVETHRAADQLAAVYTY